MKLPMVMRAALAEPGERTAWKLAFMAALLLPWMLIFSRTGAEICCALIGLSFLYRSARTRDWAWLRDPFTLVCALAWAWLLLVVTPLAIEPETSLPAAAAWLRFPMMFIALCWWVLVRRAALYGLCLSIGFMLCLVMLDTIWQYLTGFSIAGNPIAVDNRLTGPLDGAKVGLFISKLLLPVVAVCVVLAPGRLRSRAIAGSLMLMAAIATIMLSGERSAFLSTMLAVGVAMSLLVLVERRLRLPCFLASCAAMCLIGAIYMTSDAVQYRAAKMMRTIAHYSKSDYGQLVKVAYDMGMERPLHGVGLKGFRTQCPELDHYGNRFRALHPHNYYAEWLAEAGLPGLMLLVAMVALLARMAWREFVVKQGIERLLPAMALGIVAQHFFPLMGMQSFFTNWSALLLWYGLSLAFAALPPRVPRAQ